MAKSVFIYSTGDLAEDHLPSLEDGVPLVELARWLPEKTIDRLGNAYADGVCFLWGQKEGTGSGDKRGNRGKFYWNQMSPGDLALSYRHREMTSVATIIDTVESVEAAVAAWPDSKADPFKYLFFLTRPRRVKIPVELFTGNSESMYYGLRRSRDGDVFIARYGSVESLRKAIVDGNFPDALPQLSPEVADDGIYVPTESDNREKTWAEICRRRGQQAFRNAMLRRFERRCAISGCSIVDVLDAAHIKPYLGVEDNNDGNGLLLRTDIHVLLDLSLMGVNPDSLRVECHESIMHEYGHLNGRPLQRPRGKMVSREALRIRYSMFKDRE